MSWNFYGTVENERIFKFVPDISRIFSMRKVSGSGRRKKDARRTRGDIMTTSCTYKILFIENNAYFTPLFIEKYRSGGSFSLKLNAFTIRGNSFSSSFIALDLACLLRVCLTRILTSELCSKSKRCSSKFADNPRCFNFLFHCVESFQWSPFSMCEFQCEAKVADSWRSIWWNPAASTG